MTMLDDAFISLMKEKTEKDSHDIDERVGYLLSLWDEVKYAPDIILRRYDGESLRIIRDYVRMAPENSCYDYRTDPWYGYCGPYTGARDENSLRIRLLDSEDMAHDLSVLADDIRESFGITFSTIREAERMRGLLKAVSLSELLTPNLLNRDNLVQYLRKLEELESLSNAVKNTRSRILQYYFEDILHVDGAFWKGDISPESSEYRETRKRIERAKKNSGHLSDNELKALTSLVLDYRKARRDYKRKEDELSPSFPSYCGWKTDWKRVAEEAGNLLSVITEKDYGILTPVEMEEWSEVKNKAYIFYTGLNTIYEKYSSSFEGVISLWDSSVVDFRSIPLVSLEKRLHRAQKDDGLRYEWKNIDSVVKEARSTGIISFIDDALSHHIGSNDIIPAFRKALVKKAISAVYESDEGLRAVMEEKEESAEEKETYDEEFALYTPLDLRTAASSFSVGSFSSSSYGDFIKSVVDREAPLFERDLMKRLSFLGGEEYLTPETVESYKKAMECLEGVSFIRRDGFVYSIGERMYPFRKASFMRDFSHIAPEEIRSGLESIIRNEGDIEKSELYNTLGSLCGYSVVLKSRYPELDRILMSIDGITVDGDTVKAGGEK